MISTGPYETKRRFLFEDESSGLPKAHLWYSTKEVIKALKLFLEAGDDLSRSLTYRYLVDASRKIEYRVIYHISGYRFLWVLLLGMTWLI